MHLHFHQRLAFLVSLYSLVCFQRRWLTLIYKSATPVLGKCRWLKTSLRCFNSRLMRALNSTKAALCKHSDLSERSFPYIHSLQVLQLENELQLTDSQVLGNRILQCFLNYSVALFNDTEVIRIKQTQIIPDPQVFLKIVTHTVLQLGLAACWIPEKQHNCTQANQTRARSYMTLSYFQSNYWGGHKQPPHL